MSSSGLRYLHIGGREANTRRRPRVLATSTTQAALGTAQIADVKVKINAARKALAGMQLEALQRFADVEAQQQPEQHSCGGPATTPPRALPSSFLCPITHTVMRDPVVLAASGLSYERAAITHWLSWENTDPLTSE